MVFSEFDYDHSQKYKKLVNLQQLDRNGVDTLLQGSATVASNLNVLQKGIFNSDVSMNSGLSLKTLKSLDGIINVLGTTINLGDATSQVYINGTTNYVSTTNLQIKDKLIDLNSNQSGGAADLGNNAGLQILGNNGNGYIKTNEDASRYVVRMPGSNIDSFITVQDLSNNLTISGSSILNGAVTMLSTLKVSTNASVDGTLTVNTLSINGATNLNSNWNVSGKSEFKDTITASSTLAVVGNTYLKKLILNPSDISEYETNSDALSAGLGVGEVHRTGALLKLTLSLPIPAFQKFFATARTSVTGDDGVNITSQITPNTYFQSTSDYKFTFSFKYKWNSNISQGRVYKLMFLSFRKPDGSSYPQLEFGCYIVGSKVAIHNDQMPIQDHESPDSSGRNWKFDTFNYYHFYMNYDKSTQTLTYTIGDCNKNIIFNKSFPNNADLSPYLTNTISNAVLFPTFEGIVENVKLSSNNLTTADAWS